jgi:hypothetical protein
MAQREQHWGLFITISYVFGLRRAYRHGTFCLASLAVRFGMSHATIKRAYA